MSSVFQTGYNEAPGAVDGPFQPDFITYEYAKSGLRFGIEAGQLDQHVLCLIIF
jgi:hypothetical protein